MLKYKGKIIINLYNSLYYDMSRYHFVNGNYEDALKMINLLFESKFLKHTVFLEAHCRMLNLLIHYKIGNHKLLGHLIAATVKFLKSRNKFYKTEAAVINCLKKIIKAVDNGIVKNNFQLLSKELTSLKKNVYESNINIYFNYLKWSENEIENFINQKQDYEQPLES